MFFSTYINYTVHVILRHLLYLYFVTRKVSLDTLLVMLLATVLNDLLLHILFTNICMFIYCVLKTFPGPGFLRPSDWVV